MTSLQTGLFIWWAISGVLMVVFILMHSGQGGAFSDTMATRLSSSNVANSVLQKNLNIMTNIFIVLWIASIILCIWFFPQAIIGY